MSVSHAALTKLTNAQQTHPVQIRELIGFDLDEPITTLQNQSGKAAVVTTRVKGAAITLWSETWKPIPKPPTGQLGHPQEKTLQKALQAMAPALNRDWKLGEKLHWDFGISDMVTLDKYKPDGHGRWQQENGYRLSIPHLAVVVEVKTHSTLKDGIGRTLWT